MFNCITARATRQATQSLRVAIVTLPFLTAGTSARPQSAQQNTPDIPTIRQTVRLVSIDVLVTDNNGQPVPDLLPEDFQVKENGVLQTVLHAEPHLVGKEPSPNAESDPLLIQIKPEAVSTVAHFSNQSLKGPATWNVILLDLLNTTQNDQAQARKQLWQFIKTLPPSQPIALMVMDTSLHLLVPFRAGAGAIDKLLATAIANPKAAPLIEAYNADDQAILNHIEAKMPDKGAGLNTGMQTEEANRTDMRVQMVLRNFTSLADWLAVYPGRKNLFWLSTAFPLVSLPHSFGGGSTTADSAQNLSGRYAALQSEADKSLQLARVAVFPIDTRGTLGEYPGMQDATHNGGLYVGSAGAHALTDDMNDYSREQREDNLDEKQIAEDTGGIARFNNNAIDAMLQSAYQQSQSYYTISYSPINKDWNGNYRKTDLSLKKRGYRLTYRRGYYAVDLPKPAPDADDFTRALRRGAPSVNGIVFTTAVKTTPQSIVLDYTVDVSTLSFTGDTESRIAAVDCAVVLYDRTGKVLGTSQVRVDGKSKTADWPQLQRTGFPAHQVIPLDLNAATIAIGIRDVATGQFGNMEIALTQ